MQTLLADVIHAVLSPIVFSMIAWDGGQLVSCKGDNQCLPRHKRGGFSLINIALTGLGKP